MKTIEKVVKDAISAKKYKCGLRQVLKTLKGSKLIIVAKSVDNPQRKQVQEQARSANIPVYEFNGTSVQLGKLCNRPFRVTAIALKSGTDEEISSIMSETPQTKK